MLFTEPIEGHPFVSVTPIPIPHRFYGLGLADVTGDLQEINSTLWRQFLNCTYLATDPRNIVLSRGIGEEATPMVNLDQLLNAAPGGYIEEYQAGALRPYEQVSNAKDIIPALELHGKMKEQRTGISPDAMGINPDSISKHVYGTMVQSSAAATRTTLYARIFADTGVKDLFTKIYELLMRHHSEPLIVRLKNKYVPVDPTAWASHMDCQVTVALGHGSKMEKSMNLQTILEVQKALREGGNENMATQENTHKAVSDLVEALGFREAAQYFTDPEINPPQPPQPSEAEKAIMAQEKVEWAKLELQRQKQELDRDKLTLEFKKMELEHEVQIQTLRKDGYAAEPDMAWGVDPPQPPPPPTPQPPPQGPGNGGAPDG
jgi:hypothetical protein